MRISEVSPNTVEGSWSRDLVLSKLWLIRKLGSIKPNFGTIYILGSWYGNLSLLMLDRNLEFDRIINVDVDEAALHQGDIITGKLRDHRIVAMCKDANDLDYRQLGNNGLVINTSCNNIPNNGWFENIPKGAMVALQGRDNDPGSVNHHDDLEGFVDSYPLSSTTYSGRITLDDPETSYDRYMIIGNR